MRERSDLPARRRHLVAVGQGRMTASRVFIAVLFGGVDTRLAGFDHQSS